MPKEIVDGRTVPMFLCAACRGTCPQCRKEAPANQLEPKPDEVDGKKVPVVLCDACREERSRDV